MAGELLINRIESAARDCESKSRPYFTRFLTESEQAQLKNIRFPEGLSVLFFGGSGNITPARQCLGIIPSFFAQSEDELSDMFPITAVVFTFRRCDEVSHREILGTLMGLGIERDTIGDIYITEGKAAVFATDKMARYIADNVLKIGKTGVRCSLGLDFELPKRSFELMNYSVASLRLDNIVKCAACCGRTAAADKFIKPQLVQVNSVICDNVSHILKQGDIISIRGKGKFVLDSIGETGRKGNIHISVKKYI